MRPRGMLVIYGMSSGPVPPVDPAKLSEKGSLYMARTTLAHFTATREEIAGPHRRALCHDRRRQTQGEDREDISAGGSGTSPPRHGRAADDGKDAADTVTRRHLEFPRSQKRVLKNHVVKSAVGWGKSWAYRLASQESSTDRLSAARARQSRSPLTVAWVNLRRNGGAEWRRRRSF